MKARPPTVAVVCEEGLGECPRLCRVCGDTGWSRCERCRGRGRLPSGSKCPNCGGSCGQQCGNDTGEPCGFRRTRGWDRSPRGVVWDCFEIGTMPEWLRMPDLLGPGDF